MLRHAQGSAARAFLAKAPIAPPIAAEIIEKCVCGNGDGIAVLADAVEPSFALPFVAGADQVTVDRNFDRDARILRLAEPTLAFPSGAIAGLSGISVRGDCELHAARANDTIAAITPPAFIVPGVHGVGVHWNLHRCARSRTLGAKAAIAGPRGAFGGEICVRRNDDRDATSGAL